MSSKENIIKENKNNMPTTSKTDVKTVNVKKSAFRKPTSVTIVPPNNNCVSNRALCNNVKIENINSQNKNVKMFSLKRKIDNDKSNNTSTTTSNNNSFVGPTNIKRTKLGTGSLKPTITNRLKMIMKNIVLPVRKIT